MKRLATHDQNRWQIEQTTSVISHKLQKCEVKVVDDGDKNGFWDLEVPSVGYALTMTMNRTCTVGEFVSWSSSL